MSKGVIVGFVAGLILGVLQKFLLDGAWDLLIFPGILGAVIGFISSKVHGYGLLAVGAGVGAVFFAVSAMMSGYAILDHTITGAITGLIIGLIAKFIVPKLIS